jgi:tripartite-type tricarboxylate transporter receptor subunit TctC
MKRRRTDRRNRETRMLASLKSTLAVALFAVATLAAGPARAADDYPTRPVRLVVSYAAGNITDVLARMLAQRLSEQWKQPVIVENRPGQGGSIGAQTVVKTAPDGYTLLFSAMAAMAINPHVYPRVGYHPLNDFMPIIGVAQAGNGLLYVGAQVPAGTLAELVALSKAKPGSLNYGSAGSGTVPHLNMEVLKGLTGLDATHVPYKAAVAVLNDVMGGDLHLAQESLGVVLPHVQGGKIKPIATTASKRLPQLPDVPTLAELVPGFEAVSPWLGIFAPAGTPRAIVEKVHATIAAALREPDLAARITGAGLDLLNTPTAEFVNTVARDHERLGKLVRELKLQAD